MKRMKKMLVFVAMLALSITLLPRQAFAEGKQYTVTLRAGDVGSFNTKNTFFTQHASVTEINEKVVKFSVDEGTSLNQLLAGQANTTLQNINLLKTKDGYAYTTCKVDGEAVDFDKAISRNTDVVMDYGKLNNPVEYEVHFVDEETKNDIYTPLLGKGSAGDTVSISPYQVASYELIQSPSSLKLTEGKNEFQYVYRYTGTTQTVTGEGTTVTNVVPIYLPGETTYTTTTNQVTQVVPGGATPAATPAAGATTPATPATPGAVAIPEEQVPQAAEEGANPEGTAEGEGEITTIVDETTPLAAGTEEETATTIPESETPLASGTNGPAFLTIWLGGMILVLACTTLIVLLKRKRGNK